MVISRRALIHRSVLRRQCAKRCRECEYPEMTWRGRGRKRSRPELEEGDDDDELENEDEDEEIPPSRSTRKRRDRYK